MVLAQFAYSLTKLQEQFSIAYISAVTAAAGYSVDDVSIDEDSIDIEIKQRGNPNDPEDYPYYSTLRIQAKCTYRYHPQPDGYIHFPLPIKNYNDLRRTNTGDSSILVVVCIPNEFEREWLVEQDRSMLLQNTAHWVSIRGEPPVTETTRKTVLIPYTQRFCIDSLREIMNRLAEGHLV
jgi:hypothetical protein